MDQHTAYEQWSTSSKQGAKSHTASPSTDTRAGFWTQNERKIEHSNDSFRRLLDALDVMQSSFFEVWIGTWPDAIDWTAAVMGTHVSASLGVITSSNEYDDTIQASKDLNPTTNVTVKENIVNHYLTHLEAFYFGENAFALRGQAFDDMLWVVLCWLESIKFINLHSALHYPPSHEPKHFPAWFGTQFIPAFAHRARIFYDLASKGWDTSLCGGGMVWNPYLTPYKNAITNQLYISASVSMYLYFPGDNNSSPFIVSPQDSQDGRIPPAKAHDPKYLEAAIEGHKWLKSSNMTNSKGLYVDGYHVRGWHGGENGSIGTGQCNVRDEMVYTYNQGVLLSGLRGLWEATGSDGYLEEGHQLIQNVISATGWYNQEEDERHRWAGIGRNGILEESCDARGYCSQDGQTFKGIFFLHLTAFCAPLPSRESDRIFFIATGNLSSLHEASCQLYGPWIRHNAEAAHGTRDSQGRYGTWWTYGLRHRGDGVTDQWDVEVASEGTDYRNHGVPDNKLWRLPETIGSPLFEHEATKEQPPFPPKESDSWDPNARGRGRTVETQSGGLAVFRALYRIVDMVKT